MAENPFSKYAKADSNPFAAYKYPQQEKPDFESVLNEGSTLKIGPFDTGYPIGKDATQFLSGMGKRFMDIGTLGMRDERAGEKELMEKGWAQGGSAVADLASLIGGGSALRGAGILAEMPRLANAGRMLAMPATLPEAAGVGAAYSAATTNGDAKERAKAGGIGLAAGAAVPAAVALAKGGKALMEPLTKGGQEAIAGRTLRKFAGENSDDVARALRSPEVFVSGSTPTVAEASQNAGLAALQNGLASLDKGGFGNALDAAQKANRAARVGAVQGIAKDDAAIAAAQKARDEAAEALYGKAFASDRMRLDLAAQERSAAAPFAAAGMPQPAAEMPSAGLRALAKRPAFQSAMEDASVSMRNRGIESTPLNSLEGLHRIKLSIDEALNRAGEGSALARYSKSDLQAIKSDLVKEIESLSPTYQAARKTYADMSQPINQMEIGSEILTKLRPALADFGANTRETSSQYAKALRDADATAAKVTGFKGAKMADIMSPEQMATLEGVAKDLARKSSADDLIRGTGSNTAQNLATQNVLRQMFGPLGIPQTFAESALLQTAMKPLNFLYSGIGEGRIAESLGKAMLSPEEAARLMMMKSAAPRSGGLLDYTPAASTSVLPAVLPQFSQ